MALRRRPRGQLGGRAGPPDLWYAFRVPDRRRRADRQSPRARSGRATRVVRPCLDTGARECLPVAELADCARAAIERDGLAVLNYGPVGGYGPLRKWIAERHGVDPDRVLVTNGSLPGLNLVLGHFATRGRILVEAPTYDRPLKIAGRLGVEVRTIPQDEEGLDVDALERELARDPSP